MRALKEALGVKAAIEQRLSPGMRVYQKHRLAYFAAKAGEPFPSDAMATTPASPVETVEATPGDAQAFSVEKRSLDHLRRRISSLQEAIRALSNDAKARGLDIRLADVLRETDALPGLAHVIDETLHAPTSQGKDELKTQISLLLLKVEEAEIKYKELAKMILHM